MSGARAAPTAADLADHVEGIAALLAGTANVIMQLSRPPIGHAVVESTVVGGQVTRHPLKRLRTTFTYLAVAMMGDDAEREAYRQAVDRSHAAVRSRPGSPVAYDAFDPELQLWVAACLYRGAVDVRTRLHGPMDDATADAFYRRASVFGTTLQVRPDMWPADRGAFERYWQESLAHVSIDDTVRSYLTDLMRLRHLPAPVRVAQAGFSTFVTTGFLPERFRDEMRLAWSDRDQRRFDLLLAAVGAASRALPGVVRRFPFNAFLWDMRVRARLGLPLVY